MDNIQKTFNGSSELRINNGNGNSTTVESGTGTSRVKSKGDFIGGSQNIQNRTVTPADSELHLQDFANEVLVHLLRIMYRTHPESVRHFALTCRSFRDLAQTLNKKSHLKSSLIAIMNSSNEPKALQQLFRTLCFLKCISNPKSLKPRKYLYFECAKQIITEIQNIITEIQKSDLCRNKEIFQNDKVKETTALAIHDLLGLIEEVDGNKLQKVLLSLLASPNDDARTSVAMRLMKVSYFLNFTLENNDICNEILCILKKEIDKPLMPPFMLTYLFNELFQKLKKDVIHPEDFIDQLANKLDRLPKAVMVYLTPKNVTLFLSWISQGKHSFLCAVVSNRLLMDSSLHLKFITRLNAKIALIPPMATYVYIENLLPKKPESFRDYYLKEHTLDNSLLKKHLLPLLSREDTTPFTELTVAYHTIQVFFTLVQKGLIQDDDPDFLKQLQKALLTPLSSKREFIRSEATRLIANLKSNVDDV